MIQKDYMHIAFKGSAYEVGKKHGELAMKNRAFRELDSHAKGIGSV